LRPADLGTVRRDSRIVTHILRFKRRYPHATIGQVPAKGSHKKGLASITGAAHDHDGSQHSPSPKALLQQPSVVVFWYTPVPNHFGSLARVSSKHWEFESAFRYYFTRKLLRFQGALLMLWAMPLSIMPA